MPITWIRAGSIPSWTYIRLTYSDGTHSSSTSRWIGPTHACGIEPNSHGWITASRPDAAEKSGGHWWRTVTSAANGAAAPAVDPSRSNRSTAKPSAASSSQTLVLITERLVGLPWSPRQLTEIGSVRPVDCEGRSPA